MFNRKNTIFKDFLEEFKNKVDIIINGGKCKIAIAATVVSIDKNKQIKIISQGSVKIN